MKVTVYKGNPSDGFLCKTFILCYTNSCNSFKSAKSIFDMDNSFIQIKEFLKLLQPSPWVKFLYYPYVHYLYWIFSMFNNVHNSLYYPIHTTPVLAYTYTLCTTCTYQSGIFARKYVRKNSMSNRKKLVLLSLIALLQH